MAKDYYELLGVSEDASVSEIKQAYRDQIKKTHPDVNDDEQASERTKQLVEAKDTLTDKTERERYDRLGHEQYRRIEEAASSETASETQSTAGSSGNRTTNAKSNTNATAADSNASANSKASQSTQTGRQASNAWGNSQRNRADERRTTINQSWYGNSTATSAEQENIYQTWDSKQAYTSTKQTHMFELRRLFNSQQTVALLGSTFFIYPVLLFGALSPMFPPVVNVTVSLCILFIVAYLQSIPQVAVIVFGTWTVLLPFVLVAFPGVSLISLYGILALAAVVLPLGLSILVWIAIRPFGYG